MNKSYKLFMRGKYCDGEAAQKKKPTSIRTNHDVVAYTDHAVRIWVMPHPIFLLTCHSTEMMPPSLPRRKDTQPVSRQKPDEMPIKHLTPAPSDMTRLDLVIFESIYLSKYPRHQVK